MLARFERTGDRPGPGGALRVLGIVALARRDASAARRFLDDALAIARADGGPLLEAETLEAIAELEEIGRRTDEAHAGRRAAERIFRDMGAIGWGR